MFSKFGKHSEKPTTTPKSPKTNKTKRSVSNNNKKQDDDFDGADSKVSSKNSFSSDPSNSGETSNAVRIRWTSQTERPLVRGFEDQMLSLKELLGHRETDNQFKAVGIVGAFGVGKTTLCREYYLQESERQLFLPRVWVSMPSKRSKDDHEAMLRRMLISLGVEEEKINHIQEQVKPKSTNDLHVHDKLDALLYILRLQLIGKRYFLVLDNVCELDGWYENLNAQIPLVNKSGTGINSTTTNAAATATGSKSLACALPKGGGGTVIVTIRGEEMKKMVGEGNVHRVLPLSDPESILQIFFDAVELPGDPASKVEILKKKLESETGYSMEILLGEKKNIIHDLKVKVINKCNGLPLSAKLMAQTMSAKLMAQTLSKSKQFSTDDNKELGQAETKKKEQDATQEALNEKQKYAEVQADEVHL